MLTLPSTLTHEAAPGFVQTLAPLVQAQPGDVVIDAGALRKFDSSALAVLLECRRQTLAAGKTFLVRGLPASLRQLASLYGIAELIPETAAAHTPPAG